MRLKLELSLAIYVTRVVTCKSRSNKYLFKTRTLTAMIYSYSGGVVIITRTDVKWTLTGTLVNYYVWSHKPIIKVWIAKG